MVSIRSCFACGRKVKKDAVILHKFPKDPVVYSEWKKFCSIFSVILAEDNMSNYYLCSQHFKKGDYKNEKSLKDGAVPVFGNYDIQTNAIENTDKQLKTTNEVKEETLVHNKTDADEVILDPLPVKPLGDDLFRVCRTCFRIMKIEESVPLMSSTHSNSFEETKLCVRLRNFLQVDLFDVENPCLCKNCENFINVVHAFKATCRANEEVLRDFDWDCKSLNLLYVVNQDELKTVYDQTKGIKCKEEVGDVLSTLTENINMDSDVALEWRKQNEMGNSLLDMEDHWYIKEKAEKTDQDYTSETPSASCAGSIPEDDDIFSPNFDRYFERVQNKISQRLRNRCRRYHCKDEGNGPFVCEFCGEIKNSKAAYNIHVKIHKSNDDFRCTACNKVLYDWTCYLKHWRSVHGGRPNTFNCPRCPKRYLYKKMLDAHLKIHEGEVSKLVCLICGEVFSDKLVFDEHKLSHGPKKILCKLCGLSILRGSLKRHIYLKHSNRVISVEKVRKIFQCNLCRRSYTRIGCFELHKKHCDG